MICLDCVQTNASGMQYPKLPACADGPKPATSELCLTVGGIQNRVYVQIKSNSIDAVWSPTLYMWPLSAFPERYGHVRKAARVGTKLDGLLADVLEKMEGAECGK